MSTHTARGCSAHQNAYACMCAVPHYYVKETPGAACASTCDCDGERVCRGGQCRGAARPKLYAPLAHTTAVDATLEQGSALHAGIYGSRLAPINDGCTVALYNYHASASAAGACPVANRCEELGATCATMFDQDTDIERCIRANSFEASPDGALMQHDSLEALNHACCGDIADPACTGAIAGQACRWDAALRRAVSTTAAPPGSACCATQAQQILRNAAALRDGVRFSDYFAQNSSLFEV